MICMMVAYDAEGNILGTLDHMIARDSSGTVIGLVDFAAHEAAGGKLRDIWNVDGASGSGTWPEWLGGQAHSFRVELTGKQITALVHKTSGHRRERAGIEAAIAGVHPDERGRRDLRGIVGGPQRALVLDAEGRTIGRAVQSGTPRHLPVHGIALTE